MSTTFRIDCTSQGIAFTHYWERIVGSGHAPLALLYSFHNADEIVDYLLSIGMRPFVEFSFMPRTLSSGGEFVFHYTANITPPRDFTQWATLVSKLVSHLIERYGAEEVRQWFFEVWNEPNLDAFWTGTQSDYFELYRHTAEAVKGVDTQLKVGGPSTAANAWIDEFLAFCKAGPVPIDFISTHHYPTDALGSPGDDTFTQLSKSRIGVLREQVAEVRRKAGDLPVYYTEWSTSSNPRDTLHDGPYAAAYIVKVIMEQQGLVQGYSYWTFSDIFEENYFPSLPFHGGFGLMNIHGIAKPSWRAFELLHGLGEEQLSVAGEHATVSVWAVCDQVCTTVLLTNLALPRHEITSEVVRVELAVSSVDAEGRRCRIDASHACAKACWQAQGEPEYPTPAQVYEMQNASRLDWSGQSVERWGDTMGVQLELPPQSIAAIRFDHATHS